MKTLLLSIALIYTVNINAQIVNIPDASFKAYLVGASYINTNLDTEIQVSEASAYTGMIACFNFPTVSDLTGIEAFTSITSLTCNNDLTFLDVSQNIALTQLDCSGNQLTSLNVSNNLALNALWCNNNQLTSLDFSNNLALTNLECRDNQLTSLDVSHNTGLGFLNCNFNQLTSLDVSNNLALKKLYCNNNQLTSLDVSHNTDLIELSTYNNQLTSLDVANNTVLNYFDCDHNQLECLNIKNGNNSNFTSFYAGSNINLTCIEADDVAWSTANLTNIDAGASFSTNCGFCSSGLEELSTSPKELIKKVDLMGRETEFKANTSIIYIYSDGTTEKIFKFE